MSTFLFDERTFHEDEVDNNPGRDEAEEVPISDTPGLLWTTTSNDQSLCTSSLTDPVRGVQSGSEPEVLSLAAVLALRHRHVVLAQGAGGPGQRHLWSVLVTTFVENYPITSLNSGTKFLSRLYFTLSFLLKQTLILNIESQTLKAISILLNASIYIYLMY